MRIISKIKITEFIDSNPGNKKAFQEWYQLASHCKAENFTELKRTFNSVDRVNKYIIFDIGGNKLRLIAAIHFNTQILFIRRIFTHKEYDTPINQKVLREAKL